MPVYNSAEEIDQSWLEAYGVVVEPTEDELCQELDF